MKIQYMSDLHFEFRENSRYIKHNEFPVTGDILVLAGDIFYLKDRVAPLRNFWEWASKNYRQVLIVPGNHEYYNYGDVMERGLQWRWMFKENVGYYQNQVLRIDDTDFIMSTFWSHIEPADEYFVWKGLNDFHQTLYKGKLLQTETYNQMHDFCLGHPYRRPPIFPLSPLISTFLHEHPRILLKKPPVATRAGGFRMSCTLQLSD